MSAYDDLLHLPHHVSMSHPQMPRENRAAQFSPFAALSGYDAAVAETDRRTDQKVELADDEKELIRQRLQMIQEHLDERPEVTITYFVPDEKKSGGAYQCVTGALKKIDEYERAVVLCSQKTIPIDEISNIAGELFSRMDVFL